VQSPKGSRHLVDASSTGYNRRVVFLVATAAAAWFAFLLVAPIAPPAVAAIAYGLASLVCHQIPARSFHYGAVQLPVCARCIGIYGGAAAGALLFANAPTRAGSTSGRTALLAGAVPVAASVALEWSGTWAPGNGIRALTGVVLGLAAASVVIGAAATLHYDECAPRRPIAPSPPPTRI